MLANRSLRLSLAFTLFVASTSASATAQRTFVSASGVDNPNCSLATPCRSFSSAITTTSAGGEIIVLDSAGYGRVTITKSVSIMGLVGIYHQASNDEMIVLDTITRDIGDAGVVLVAYNASIVLDHVRSEHNTNVGFYVAPVVPATFAAATITDSMFAHNGGNGIWADSVGGASTQILVERSVFSSNVQHGFYANAGASGAQVRSTLTHNSFIKNGGDGIHSLGIPPGATWAYVSENAVHYGGHIVADGNFSFVHASGNTGEARLKCINSGAAYTLGNNNLDGANGDGSCTIITLGGY